jgi:hypothetical protein
MEQKKPSEGRDLSSGRWHLVSNSSDLGFHLVHGTAAHQECRREGKGGGEDGDLYAISRCLGRAILEH